MADETREVIIIDLQIQEGNKKVKEESKEVDVLAKSILGLRKESKALRAERDLLDTTTEESIKRIQELNDAIDENDALIKKNSTTLEKQRLNVGNYKRGITDALKEIRIGGVNVGDVVDKLQKANEDLFQGMIAGYKQSAIGAKLFGNAARTALTLTGIGIFIAGLATIIAYWDDIKIAIGLADSRQQQYFENQQNALLKSKELLDEYISSMEIQNQILQVQGDREKEIFENKRKTLEMELKLAENIQKNASDRINGYIKENNLTAENLKLRASVAKATGIKDPFIERIAELVEKFNDASKSVVNYKNLLALLNAEENKYNEDRAKRAADEAKRIAEEEFEFQRWLKNFKDKDAASREAFEKEKKDAAERSVMSKKFIDESGAQTSISIKNIDLLTDARRNAADAEAKYLIRSAELQEEIEGRKTDAIGEGLSRASTLFRQNTIAYKIMASAQAVINAALAASRAYAEYPYPYSLGVSILAGAQAAYEIAEINKVKFKKGGEYKYVPVGGRSHDQGGTTYVGEDGGAFEVEKDEGIFILNKKTNKRLIGDLSRENVHDGGKSFGQRTWYAAQGGQIETRKIARASQNANQIEQAVASAMLNLPPIYVVAQDVAEKLNTEHQVKSRAKVV